MKTKSASKKTLSADERDILLRLITLNDEDSMESATEIVARWLAYVAFEGDVDEPGTMVRMLWNRAEEICDRMGITGQFIDSSELRAMLVDKV